MSENRPARRRVAGERGRPQRPVVTEPEVSGPEVAGPETAVPEPEVLEPEAAEPEAAEPRPAPTRRWGTPFAVTVAALAVLLVAAAAAAGVLAFRVQRTEAADSARGEAAAAARAHAQKILSYDHRTLDADFAAARKALTGSFKDQYATTTDTVVRPSAEQYKAVVEAEVVATSVVRASADRVVVLVFVDQTTTSTRLEGPKVDLNRVRMTLVDVDGNWLVSELDAL